MRIVFSGDPIADAFAVCARTNSCALVIADGVNWGEKSMLAARCAVYGATKHINRAIFEAGGAKSTHVSLSAALWWLVRRPLLLPFFSST